MITAFAHSQGQSSARELKNADAIREALSLPKTTVWVDFFNPSQEEIALLKSVFGFHDLAIEDCVAESLHPKVDDYGGYLYMVLHGVVEGTEGDVRTEELDVFLGANYLVTFHFEPRRSVDYVLKRVREICQPMVNGPDRLLAHIIEKLIDHYDPVTESFDDQMTKIEEKVFESPDRTIAGEIFRLRKQVMNLRRIVVPQREVIHRLGRGEFDEITPQAVLFFRDLDDQLYRLRDYCESFRELLSGVLEVHLAQVSNRLNEVMKVLAVISTIMLPLSVIAGVYGMNFEYMPELHWRYGYPFALLLMLLVAGSLMMFFRRRGWFD